MTGSLHDPVLKCSTKNLAGIKDTIRIERLFYGPHHLDSGAGFRSKINFLALANTVFALRWLRSFGQFLRLDKWSVCQGQAAKRTGGKLCTP